MDYFKQVSSVSKVSLTRWWWFLLLLLLFFFMSKRNTIWGCHRQMLLPAALYPLGLFLLSKGETWKATHVSISQWRNSQNLKGVPQTTTSNGNEKSNHRWPLQNKRDQSWNAQNNTLASQFIKHVVENPTSPPKSGCPHKKQHKPNSQFHQEFQVNIKTLLTLLAIWP